MTYLRTAAEFAEDMPSVTVGQSGIGYWWAQLPTGKILTGATELIVWDNARIALGLPHKRKERE